MSAIPYTSIDRVLAKIDREIGIEGIPETHIIEWTGEALQAMQVASRYEEAVALIEVKNHQCNLPVGFHTLIQVGRNTCWNESTSTGLCPAEITEVVNPLETPAASRPVVLDCQGQPIQAYELAYYRPYFDVRWGYDQYRKYCSSTGCFVPVRPASHAFYASLVTFTEDDDAIYGTCTNEYSIIQNKLLRLSFKDGQVAVAYLRQMVDDETGYPMIPDEYSTLTAIVEYVRMKLAKKDADRGREGAEGRLERAQKDWQWYCGQASCNALILKTADEFEDFRKSRSYLIPRTDAYDNFFGQLSAAEDRGFNNPGRNFSNVQGYP